MVIKLLAIIFYRFQQCWLGEIHKSDWAKINTIIMLNHTSLFEPLLLRCLPLPFLWQFSQRLVLPAAQETLARPLVGRILRLLVPGCIPISRKNDDSWQYFLQQIDEQTITAIMPEGCMKRADGLDKYGDPMRVRAGVVDMLNRINSGHILFVYSGGLHHIQSPGEKFPKIFKTIKVNLEIVDIKQYKLAMQVDPNVNFTAAVLNDLQASLVSKIPT